MGKPCKRTMKYWLVFSGSFEAFDARRRQPDVKPSVSNVADAWAGKGNLSRLTVMGKSSYACPSFRRTHAERVSQGQPPHAPDAQHASTLTEFVDCVAVIIAHSHHRGLRLLDTRRQRQRLHLRGR